MPVMNGVIPLLYRRPVFDRRLQHVGYRLWVADGEAVPTPASAAVLKVETAAVLERIAEIGAQTIFGEKLAILDCPIGLVGSDCTRKLDPRRCMLHIVSDDDNLPVDSTAIDELTARGFKLSADFPLLHINDAALIARAELIHLDTSATAAKSASARLATDLRRGAKLLGVNIENTRQLQTAQGQGCHYFEGRLLAHPRLQQGRSAAPLYTLVLRALTMAQEEADFVDIERVLKDEVAVTFRLLRYVNSPGFGAMRQITSLRGALNVLGYRQLVRWLALSLVTADVGNGVKLALGRAAVVRGRMLESLASHFAEPNAAEELFLVGTFSLLDSILDTPMTQALERVSLPAPVAAALTDRSGRYGPMLQLVEAIEFADTQTVGALMGPLQIDAPSMNLTQLEALAWVEALTS